MNIDLRNISEQFELEVTRVKQKYGFNTNSKAVEHCTTMFLKRELEIQNLKEQLNDKTRELNNEMRKLNSLKEILSTIME